MGCKEIKFYHYQLEEDLDLLPIESFIGLKRENYSALTYHDEILLIGGNKLQIDRLKVT